MKTVTVIGLVLVVLGILGFVFQRVSFTDTDTLIDAGPVQVQTEERRSVPIPDIASGVAVAAGVIMIIAGASASSRS